MNELMEEYVNEAKMEQMKNTIIDYITESMDESMCELMIDEK